jgi:hypothetical protein
MIRKEDLKHLKPAGEYVKGKGRVNYPNRLLKKAFKDQGSGNRKARRANNG